MGRKKQAQQKRSSGCRTEIARQRTPPKPYRGLPPASPPLSPREYLEVHSLDALDSFFRGNETVALDESALNDTIVGGENRVPIEAAPKSRTYRQLFFTDDESTDGELDQAFIEEPEHGRRRANFCYTYRGLIKKKGRKNPAEVIRYVDDKGNSSRWFFRPLYARFCSTSHGYLKFDESRYEGTGEDLDRILKILDKVSRNRVFEMAELEKELENEEYGVLVETKDYLLPLRNIQFGIANLKKDDPDRAPEHDEPPAYVFEP
ncbi:Oidioi.mRNA.OKI2018_I69.PAR.g13023.t1.cds [Oikopleura dioica]|uniref:Oidioi.mRNA.OKI2018_I69.PAR.g13023.t1.cds n=1 Tax=Oikopleura dioica TaxID=34765 RepID=A0ABN7S7G3_OIKDI|nr:Oidioi.mRNA.OKI2018_I69.PAR.g13023.t1.cds [Oikopleura dioica]